MKIVMKSNESNEKIVRDILKLQDIFLKTILLHLYHADCSFFKSENEVWMEIILLLGVENI